ncbi:MAG: DinB family protein [Flavobacteriaceae bacterium]
MQTSDLNPGDFLPFSKPYIDVVGDAELMNLMRRQRENFPQFMRSIPPDKLLYAYGEGKWTVLEVLVHIMDAERVFQYRALRFARKDATPLPGFDQDIFVPNSGANERSIEDVIAEYQAIRGATLSLFEQFDEEVFHRHGIASGGKMTVGALGFMICGHQKHHRNVLRERYLQG